jgi:hypothetical protein
MKNISIKDNTELLNSENNSLSILIHGDGFSYTLFNKSERRFCALVYEKIEDKSNFIDQFVEFVKNESLDKVNDVNIVIAEKKSTIVPDAFFDESRISELYFLNFPQEENKIIRYSKLEKCDNYIIFSLDRDLLQAIDAIFPKYKMFSQSHSFVEKHFTANKLSENPESQKVFINVFHDFFEVLVLEKSAIKFYNTYSYKTNNDLFYYIINVFEQLKISADSSSVVFSGFIETDNVTVLNLRKFVSQVYFESQNMEFKYYYRFQETAPHYFYNFLNIVACV